jgi:hypothetical protein
VNTILPDFLGNSKTSNLKKKISTKTLKGFISNIKCYHLGYPGTKSTVISTDKWQVKKIIPQKELVIAANISAYVHRKNTARKYLVHYTFERL